MATPSNQTILTDQTAEFVCRVGGDPSPEILWRRNDGKMPIGRAHILEDKSLHIERVNPQDQGTYICEANNGVGTISASATLTVHCEYSNLLPPSLPLLSLLCKEPLGREINYAPVMSEGVVAAQRTETQRCALSPHIKPCECVSRRMSTFAPDLDANRKSCGLENTNVLSSRSKRTR